MEKEIVKHMTFLYKIAYRLTKNHQNSEDLVQETLLRALDKKHLFIKESNLKIWLYVILFNIFRNKYRKNNTINEIAFNNHFIEDFDNMSFKNNYYIPPNQLPYLDLIDTYSLINGMNVDKQRIIILCIEQLTYEEIAEILNIPVGTVKSKISRIREELKRKLE